MDIPCNDCIHKDVCAYKHDCEVVRDGILDVAGKFIKKNSYVFDAVISCKYYQKVKPLTKIDAYMQK